MVEISAIAPVFIAFAIVAVMGPFVIPVLRNLKFSQTERTYGVESHLKKAGTPTKRMQTRQTTRMRKKRTNRQMTPGR